SKRSQECNWMQGMEGDLDSSHLGFLHASTISRTKEHSGAPSAQWMEDDITPLIQTSSTPGGLLVAARRDATPDTYYWRICQWLMPWFTTIPGFVGDGPLAGHAWIPADTDKSWVFTFSYHPTRPLKPAEVEFMKGGSAVHAELIPGTFVPVANKSNE